MSEHALQVEPIAAKIRPLLAGHDPMIQSAVLADLLAIYLAGFWVPGDPESTRSQRDELLSLHLALVHVLLPINARMLGTWEEE
jgi:hypothetical protein